MKEVLWHFLMFDIADTCSKAVQSKVNQMRQEEDARSSEDDQQPMSDEDVQRSHKSRSVQRSLVIASSPPPEDAPTLDEEELALAEDLGGSHNDVHGMSDGDDGDFEEKETNGMFLLSI